MAAAGPTVSIRAPANPTDRPFPISPCATSWRPKNSWSTRSPAGLDRLEALQKRLASDPNWNGGWYYDNGGIARTLEEIRFETLMAYGQNEILAETMPDPKAREAAIRANAKAWSQIYDGHSMVVLRRAIGSFDITAD